MRFGLGDLVAKSIQDVLPLVYDYTVGRKSSFDELDPMDPKSIFYGLALWAEVLIL